MMNKSGFRITLFLASSILAVMGASCQIPESERIPEVLEMIPQSTSISAMETEVSVSVNCDLHWNVELQDPSWGEVEIKTVEDGTGGTFLFKPGANTGEDARENTLILKAGKGELRKTITQGGLGTFFQPRSFQLSGTAEAGISFMAPSSWTATVTDGMDWLKLRSSAGAKGQNVLLLAATDPNENVGSRQGTVSITFGTTRVEIPVTQVQKDVILAGDTTLSFSFEGQDFALQTQYNVDYKVSVSADWIGRSSTKAPLHEAQEHFILQENNGKNPRTAEIRFTSEGHPDASLVVTVTQDGKDPILNQTQPGMYGIEGKDYILGSDGWNQSYRRRTADGNRTYRLMKAQTFSAVTISGMQEGDSDVSFILMENGFTYPELVFQTRLVFTRDGLAWYKASDETFFVIQL
jgi:hypothetical protein